MIGAKCDQCGKFDTAGHDLANGDPMPDEWLRLFEAHDRLAHPHALCSWACVRDYAEQHAVNQETGETPRPRGLKEIIQGSGRSAERDAVGGAP